ncbi:hypothetical protein BN946_scf184788.g20 [Trametes cinnabarina]|uniref:Uncharacterized protein n=1 Tax=Pycnoporus cinnabarinus TaxID=5643 RepID=A0A060S725_PYCCI|nr:hypothetical protein BN946_scf184788.g20 [Trametes cinnabarina]
MLAAPLLAVILAASSAFAFPRARESAQDICQSSAGDNAVATYGPFTLAAVNKTLGIQSNNSEPLQLSPSVTNSTLGQWRSLATNKTYPLVEFPAFALNDGGLIGVNNASTGIGAQADDPKETYPFTFEVLHTTLNPAPVFCGIVGTSAEGNGPAILAIHGDTENFAICHSEYNTNGTSTPLDIVVYRPRAINHNLYNFRSCYSVYLQLVPTAAGSTPVGP